MIRREERAKQFAPFEALTGLRAALRQVELEHDRVERREVSDEQAANIGAVLAKIEKGTVVRITYYNNGYYVNVEGAVTVLDSIFRFIKIGNGKIFFDDIWEIKTL